MSSVARQRQRRRIILTCVECRKRKQKCDRGQPCAQCIARGPECICTYEKFRSPNTLGHGSSQSNESSPSSKSVGAGSQVQHQDASEPALLRHAHDYGYSNSDSLTSMGMLTKVISAIDADISTSGSAVVPPQIRGRIRAEFYAYVRRLPSKAHCETLFKIFFSGVNALNSALDEVIFREQSARWWSLAYDVLLREGPERLPADLQYFPALTFQVLAVSLQFLPTTHESKLHELKFSPSQTFVELSREYSDCGVALSSLLREQRPTLVGIQQSFLRDFWLTNNGDLLQAWIHSGQTVKDAMAIGLHLEPELPVSSKPEELLDALWMNELRRRTWLNLFVWDNYMALALGRAMFIDLKKCTVTAPLDCNIPIDRLKRVPVARSDSDKPTPMTERLLRHEISRRFCEIRELEAQGPIPQAPEKVKELHDFAVNFRRKLPAFYRISDPDTSWDATCYFVPIHRYLMVYLVDSFLMALHRPYVFTRAKSQRQVYESALAILDSQDGLFEISRTLPTQFNIGLTFPTFDAAVLLAVVLVSNPEWYHGSFSRPYESLKRALERLKFIGSVLPLAKTGSEILETTLRRVVEAHERSGSLPTVPTSDLTSIPSHILHEPEGQYSPLNEEPKRVSQSPDAEPWRFEVNPSEMDWAAQNPEFFDSFDFSNLEVPMPLKELLYDEEIATGQPNFDVYEPIFWAPGQETHGQVTSTSDEQLMMDGGDNSLWNFLAGYSEPVENGAP